MRRHSAGLVLTLVLAAALFSQGTAQAVSTLRPGQSAAGQERTLTVRFESKLMRRPMPYRVVLPDGYRDASSSGKKYPVVYLLHGLTGNFENWTTKTALEKYTAGHDLIIVTPEGENGWYTDSATAVDDKYESHIIKELVPEIDKKYRTLASREHRAIAGLSMGGFGALKFGIKYPEMFSVAGSFSGALGAPSFGDEGSGTAISRSINSIFGPPRSDTRRANDIFGLVRDLPADKIRSLPFLYIDCGTEDFLFRNNLDFVQVLVERKVPHEFRQLPGGHTWAFWNTQVQEFLRVAERYIR